MFGSRLDTEHLFEDDGRMGRTRVLRRRLLALIAIGGLVAVLSGPVANAVGTGRPFEGPSSVYVVRPGDTLWAIATRSAPSVDPRLVVQAIRAANHIDPGSLVPGQQLSVPSVE